MADIVSNEHSHIMTRFWLYDTHIDRQIQNFKNVLNENVIGRDVIFKTGKFKGRKGRVTHLTFSSNIHGHFEFLFLAQPYNLSKNAGPDDLLWDDSEARSYRPYTKYDWLMTEQEKKDLGLE